uniref:Uncharacterized protein n=1 Tax=Tanacetum cinerariifolium TaxID=118510 RepID=A0A6L2M862_TANCI|nr:hypothetical protein [Tanacetum cinerariifolium]
MRADELYKFLDGTIKKVQDELHHRVIDFDLGYNKEMSRRKWAAIDKKRSELIAELIDKQRRETRIIQNLKRLVGARELEIDYKLMTPILDLVHITTILKPSINFHRLLGLNIRGLEIQHDFRIFKFFRVLGQLLLPSYLSAILAVRILIDIDSSSELLKGLHAQDLLDHFQIKTKDFEINLCVPIYLYTFPILEKLNGSSALAWSIIQGSIRIFFEQSIAAIKGYRGGSGG